MEFLIISFLTRLLHKELELLKIRFGLERPQGQLSYGSTGFPFGSFGFPFNGSRFMGANKGSFWSI